MWHFIIGGLGGGLALFGANMLGVGNDAAYLSFLLGCLIGLMFSSFYEISFEDWDE